MGGFIVTGENPWEHIERVSGMTKKEFERGTGHSLLLRPAEGKNYRVEDLETLFVFAADTLNLRLSRYCVIENAEFLTEIVQNKLLKILEDGDIIFFLIAPDSSVFLDTVRSRLITITGSSRRKVSQLEQFRGLNRRTDLFFRLHLMEKDNENAFFSMSMPDFLLGVQQMFLGSLTEDSMNLGKLWSAEARISIISICGKYLSLSSLTKEDLFNFIAHICAL